MPEVRMAKQTSIRFPDKMSEDLLELARLRYGPDERAFSMIVRHACRELIRRDREAKK